MATSDMKENTPSISGAIVWSSALKMVAEYSKLWYAFDCLIRKITFQEIGSSLAFKGGKKEHVSHVHLDAINFS
jgi:hypothetical protein